MDVGTPQAAREHHGGPECRESCSCRKGQCLSCSQLSQTALVVLSPRGSNKGLTTRDIPGQAALECSPAAPGAESREGRGMQGSAGTAAGWASPAEVPAEHSWLCLGAGGNPSASGAHLVHSSTAKAFLQDTFQHSVAELGAQGNREQGKDRGAHLTPAPGPARCQGPAVPRGSPQV